jgi:hypothetical protein
LRLLRVAFEYCSFSPANCRGNYRDNFRFYLRKLSLSLQLFFNCSHHWRAYRALLSFRRRMMMGRDAREYAGQVSGPDGDPLTVADLPPPRTTRWVARRKAEVVAAVHGGLLSLHEACERYTLTVEEFLAWQAAIDRHGLAGLRATRAQEYRSRRVKASGFTGPERRFASMAIPFSERRAAAL